MNSISTNNINTKGNVRKITNVQLYINVDFILADFQELLDKKKILSYFDYWYSHQDPLSLELYNLSITKNGKYFLRNINLIFPRWNFTFLINCSSTNSKRNCLLRELWLNDKINKNYRVIFTSDPYKDLDFILDSNSDRNIDKFLISSDVTQLSQWIEKGGLGRKLIFNNTDEDLNQTHILIQEIQYLSNKLVNLDTFSPH